MAVLAADEVDGSARTVAAPRLPALDTLRAVGALAVVATHVGFNTGAASNGFWGGILARFDAGVAVFFVLSGFLLFRPFAFAAATGERRPGVGRYLFRRALRILPAYWVAVAGYLLLLEHEATVSTRTWVQHLTLTQIYTDDQFLPTFGHAWSLCTEVAFYLVLPLAALVVLIGQWRPVRVLMLVALGGLGITVGWLTVLELGLVDGVPERLWLPSYAVWFAAGMALATVHVALATGTAPAGWRVIEDLGSAPVACWTIAFGALAVAATPLAGPRNIGAFGAGEFSAKLMLYTVVGAMLLLPLAFGPQGRIARAFTTAPARWLGTVSYGLFLWHPFIIALIYRPGGRPLFTGDPLSTFAIATAGGLALASASYYLMERPIQRLFARGPARQQG